MRVRTDLFFFDGIRPCGLWSWCLWLSLMWTRGVGSRGWLGGAIESAAVVGHEDDAIDKAGQDGHVSLGGPLNPMAAGGGWEPIGEIRDIKGMALDWRQ